jgi:hypothetical protein
LRTLAKSGRGLYHFVSDYQDIEKVFVNEVQSLISQVAKRVEVSVDYDPNLQVEKVYGYTPRFRANGFSVVMDDMNNGLTQVIMTRFRARNPLKTSSTVKIRLSYFDVQRKKTVAEFQEVKLVPSEKKFCDLLADVEVKKNYTIAELAQSLFDMTAAARARNYRQAENFLNASVSETYKRETDLRQNFALRSRRVCFVARPNRRFRRDCKGCGGRFRRHRRARRERFDDRRRGRAELHGNFGQRYQGQKDRRSARAFRRRPGR